MIKENEQYVYTKKNHYISLESILSQYSYILFNLKNSYQEQQTSYEIGNNYQQYIYSNYEKKIILQELFSLFQQYGYVLRIDIHIELCKE